MVSGVVPQVERISDFTLKLNRIGDSADGVRFLCGSAPELRAARDSMAEDCALGLWLATHIADGGRGTGLGLEDLRDVRDLLDSMATLVDWAASNSSLLGERQQRYYLVLSRPDRSAGHWFGVVHADHYHLLELRKRFSSMLLVTGAILPPPARQVAAPDTHAVSKRLKCGGRVLRGGGGGGVRRCDSDPDCFFGERSTTAWLAAQAP